MRKKIKQLMNREEGFTLVELLAVIVILGIIVAIAVPSIGNVISRAESNAAEAEVELVVDAARLYSVENEITGTETINVRTLITKGFLEEVNDADGNPKGTIKDTDGVEIAKDDSGNYSYKFVKFVPLT